MRRRTGVHGALRSASDLRRCLMARMPHRFSTGSWKASHASTLRSGLVTRVDPARYGRVDGFAAGAPPTDPEAFLDRRVVPIVPTAEWWERSILGLAERMVLSGSHVEQLGGRDAVLGGVLDARPVAAADHLIGVVVSGDAVDVDVLVEVRVALAPILVDGWPLCPTPNTVDRAPLRRMLAGEPCVPDGSGIRSLAAAAARHAGGVSDDTASIESATLDAVEVRVQLDPANELTRVFTLRCDRELDPSETEQLVRIVDLWRQLVTAGRLGEPRPHDVGDLEPAWDLDAPGGWTFVVDLPTPEVEGPSIAALIRALSLAGSSGKGWLRGIELR